MGRASLSHLSDFELNDRIEEMWGVIERKRVRGEDTAALESRWLRLMAEQGNRRYDEQEPANAATN